MVCLTHTGGDVPSHPTFPVNGEPKGHKEWVVRGFQERRALCCAGTQGSFCSQVAFKPIQWDGVAEELNFELYLIHFNLNSRTLNSPGFFTQHLQPLLTGYSHYAKIQPSIYNLRLHLH